MFHQRYQSTFFEPRDIKKNTTLLYNTIYMLEAFLNLFTVFNLTILASILLFRKESSRANIFLAIAVFVPAPSFFINCLIFSKLIFTFYLAPIFVLSNIWAPFVLFYLKSILGYKIRAKEILVHSSIQILYTIIFIVGILKGKDFLTGIYSLVIEEKFSLHLTIYNVVLLFQAIVYLVYIRFVLIPKLSPLKVSGADKGKKLEAKNKDLNPLTYEYKWKWCVQLANLIILLNVAGIAFNIVFEPRIANYILLPLLYNLIFYFIVYKSFGQSWMISPPVVTEEKDRYVNSSISRQQSEEYYNKVRELMSADKCYLNPDLKLDDLASQLKIPANYISQAINQNEGKNFNEFMNTYRVQEAILLMEDPKNLNLSIEGIAYESGFGSKTSFNRIFKSTTGQTPSDYWKNARRKVES